MIERIILIVLDSLGVGELPDADAYGDQGSNTLGNMARVLGGLALPYLQRMGLGNIIPVEGVAPFKDCKAAWGKMAEKSKGKDTTTGHWEMMGVVTEHPFPVYPKGFPPEIIDRFETGIQRRTLGNKVASGTEIIEELGSEHIRTGFPIVYTSADSVFQVAAHEDVIRPDELYNICHKARAILQGEHGVARVIARPFSGEVGRFIRTDRRHDFSLEPTGKTALDYLLESGKKVTAIGKINDIFAGRGISRSIHTRDNTDGLDKTLAEVVSGNDELVFVNLVDFDMKYGHRNDPVNYARALAEVDEFLPRIVDRLKESDVLILTADHGCDPTTNSTDHSREYVPLLLLGNAIKPGCDLGVRETFADLGKTITDFLGVTATELAGQSFANQVVRG
ncbi:MAG: phosphopentomutase [Chitinophagales bacterium]